MKTNDKLLHLINHGFSGSLLGKLNENQVNVLYKKLVDSKNKVIKEQVTTKTTTIQVVGPKGGVVNKDGKTFEIKPGQLPGTMEVVGEENDLENDDIPLAIGSKGDDNMALALSNMELTEKFASKAQQKYFWSKCNKSKGKQKETWCERAKEFSDKTSKKQFKTMPEKLHPEKTVKYKKKKETNENYLDMVGKAMNNNMKNKIADIKPGLKWESEIERGIMKLIERNLTPKMTKRDFIKTIMESPEVLPKPDTKPRPDVLPQPPKPDFDPFDDPDPSDDPEARNPEVLPKPDTKPRPDVLPQPPKPDFDPFDDPDPSDDPEAGSRGLDVFMGQVKKNRMLKK
jgi:hypothetical protein